MHHRPWQRSIRVLMLSVQEAVMAFVDIAFKISLVTFWFFFFLFFSFLLSYVSIIYDQNVDTETLCNLLPQQKQVPLIDPKYKV